MLSNCRFSKIFSKAHDMQGTRLYPALDEKDFLLRVFQTPGAYACDSDGHWFATTPNGMAGALGAHQVTEHEDGTITVSPSILTTQGQGGPSWHGYLERGVWREC